LILYSHPAMHRRAWIAAAFLAVLGCSSKPKSAPKKKSGVKSHAPTPRRRTAGSKGPKTMGNLLLESYIADLKTGTTEKKISAAHELGNMGSGAKSAISALESLSSDANPAISKAAKQALKAIQK